MKPKARKPKPLHFYTATLWCERFGDEKRLMLKSVLEYPYDHRIPTELNISAHKRLWKWLKQATEWCET